MLTIGLTGGIASGKSTVAQMIKQLGIPLIDADQYAREVVEPGERAYDNIVAHFGEQILHSDQTIDRKKLGAIIFNDDLQRKALNDIVHPEVRRKMNEQKNHLISNGQDAVLDIPLLFESGLTGTVDKVLLVYVNQNVQLERLMERDESTRKEAESRIKSQMPLGEKLDRADEVIDNNGTREHTRAQLIKILKKWDVITS